MECLDANAVQDLMSGALDATARASTISHLDGCSDCRELLGTLAREVTKDVVRDANAATVTSPSGKGLATTVPANRDSTPLAPKVSRYTNLERLGAGAMGVVYRADDPELGRKVALKLLKRPDPELTERLVREARSMARVSHPNVVAVYDVGVSGDSTYIAMELVDGITLRHWQTATHSIAEIVEAYIAAGRGLSAAHDAGIVHRDFKPDNCLVGPGGRIRVTDFGLAAAQLGEGGGGDAGVSDIGLTTAGSVLGTPAYMSPEQFTGGNVDTRTDQFNYSVALYEALYGHRPFAGKTFEELGDNVCDGKVKPAPAGTRVSSALRAIVLRGLAVKPGDRWPTMDHMLAELGRDRARAWSRTALVGALVGGVLGLGLVADLVVRDRGQAQVRESFANTRLQTDRAFELLRGKFEAMSNLAYLSPATQEVSAHYDNADFGLGTQAEDSAALDHLHQLLVSTDWVDFARKLTPDVLAIADKKGRLLYTSAQLDAWDRDLTGIPGIEPLLHSDHDAAAIQLIRGDDPKIAPTRLLGGAHRGLSVMFVRTLVHEKAVDALFMQVADGERILDDIRLDKATRLALVAESGETVGDVPDEVIAAAPDDDSIAQVSSDGDMYMVQAQTVAGMPEVRVVMARPVGGVLALFPHARVVFALAMFVALGAAGACWYRARRIAGA